MKYDFRDIGSIMAFLAILFSAFGAFANVPTIQVSSFSPGKTWIWEYRDEADALYSTERYQVISVEGARVMIEMATKFPVDREFRSHHRIHADVAKCLRSYANPVDHKAWSFEMFYLDNGEWQKFSVDTTAAFEEKFNCDPHVHSRGWNRTAFSDFEGEPIFSQKGGDWFFLNGPNAGIEAFKTMGHGPGQPVYRVRLVPDE